MTKIAIVVLLAILIPVTASAQIPEAVVPDTRNASTFVSDVTIPDGTMMSPGQSFTKTWQIKNSGSTIWSGYSLAFDRGTQMGGPSSVPVPMTMPGATVDISILMIAPTEGGNHRGTWRMRTADGEFFGQDVFVLILVKSSTYEGRAFEDWEADLQVHLPDVRKKALKAMTNFGLRATPVLIKTFRSDPDVEIRTMAFGALADIRPQSHNTIRVLLEVASDPSPSIDRSIAMMVIYEMLPSRIGPETVPALVEAMRDTNAMRRKLAIQLLAPLGSVAKEAVPTLHELADNDPAPQVRNIANEALKFIEQ